MRNSFHHSSFIIHHSSRAGFTLIEILMAIGILVVGLTGVIALYAVAVDAHRATVEQAGAASLAESMLSSITADFTARDVDLDNTATFVESFVDLCTKYKAVPKQKDDDTPLKPNEVGVPEWQQGLPFLPEYGVPAPNSPGFHCEVSIYPLPRRLWVDQIRDVPLPTRDPDEVSAATGYFTGFDDADPDDATVKRIQEYQFDVFMLGLKDGDHDTLSNILAQALEYKLVVKTIRGEGKRKQVEVFETIITPRGRVE